MDANFSEDLARARAGDARAAAIVGRQLLFGREPSGGIAWLCEASKRGDGEAALLLARLAAHGVMEARDTAKALDLLALSAARGWAPAQAELRFLAREEGDDWQALRRAIDFVALTKPPPRGALCENPRMRVFEGFAAPAECDWLIERVRADLRRAQVYAGTPDMKTSNKRTNSEADLAVTACDVVTALIFDRIAAAAGVTRAFCEVAKVLNYQPGQEFALHPDFFALDNPPLRAEAERNGQRIATFLIYLNDDYEGGETDFPKAGVRFKGRKGDALLFVNVDETGAPNPNALHAGLPPTSGEKWVLSQWVRGKAINAFATPGAENETLTPDWFERV